MITDKLIQDAYLQQYERGILKKEVRSYEVSIWTLQDDFITVLKWSDLENKGKILFPKLTIADDGTLEFTFKIPHYYNDNGVIIENPCWQHTINGNLMINMRKIKVIFNKKTTDEEVFEFLITKITDSHSGDVIDCEVHCEGLAFHELGKIGYKYVLSLDEYMADVDAWQNSPYTTRGAEKKANVQYWCEKAGLKSYKAYNFSGLVTPKEWYYEIQMYYYSSTNDAFDRRTDTVYEDAYVSEWDEYWELKPLKIESAREKERIVEMSNSNVYNITLEIAKQFGIFCKYEYSHDDNYHISKRKVIFFNNFIHDKNTMAFTYPYSSKSVTRELDGTDIITKMYVSPMADETLLCGEANITDCKANRTLDDYVINFDYLKETDNLNKALLNALNVYEKDIHHYNQQIVPLLNKIAALENLETEYKAKIEYYTNSITIDKELIGLNSALMQELVAQYGNEHDGKTYIEGYTQANPDFGMIITDKDGRYCIKLHTHKKGIDTDSLKIYRTRNTLSLTDEVTNFYFTYDSYGNPEYIYGTDIYPRNNESRVYMTYSYEPHLYYEAIVETWSEKLGKDEDNLLKYTNLLSSIQLPYGVEYLLTEARQQLDTLVNQKDEYVAQFNALMGPALREGYWQPEDYQDYGEGHHNTHLLPINGGVGLDDEDTGEDFLVGWDDDLFEEELKLYFNSTVKENRISYPCINISSIFNDVAALVRNNTAVSVMFNTNYTAPPANISDAFTNVKYIKNYVIGSEAIFAFVLREGSSMIYPALILVGAKSLSDEQLAHIHTLKSYISIGVLQTTIGNKTVTVSVQLNTLIPLSHDLSSEYWNFDGVNYKSSIFAEMYHTIYPRIKFSSIMLKTDDSSLYLYYNLKLLKNYEEFYVNTKTTQNRDYFPEYWLTLKPMVLLKAGTYNANVEIYYTLSNASTAIYLDALEIAKENAYPKVSYTVEPNVLNPDIISTLYKKLNWLVMINDHQLKFNNVFGYISRLELDLDNPLNDTIEVKNYKNKFEDIFSTILASTDEMQRNSGILGDISRGTYSLTSAGLRDSLGKTDTDMINLLSLSIIASEPVKNYLSEVFTEASTILGDANHALGLTVTLTSANANILSGFSELILRDLIPHVYKQKNKPTTFKKGDIWILVDWDNLNSLEVEVARYMAMSDSSDSRPGYGWSKTYGGSLSGLAGPGIDIDPETGTIDLHGNYASIRGEETVEIMGVQVNIGSSSHGALDYGGINLVASYHDDDDFRNSYQSQVLIHPDEIFMYGSKITMLTNGQLSRKDVTAIKMSGDDGLWMGASKGIKLFSTSLGATDAGAIAVIDPVHILFGVNEGNQGTAVELTKNMILLGAGNVINTDDKTAINTGITGVTGGLIGAKLTGDSIGLATVSNNVVNALLMNNNGITLASGGVDVRASTGALRTQLLTSGASYVRVAAEGVDIGSSGYLHIDTNNFKIMSDASNGDVLLGVYYYKTNAYKPALLYRLGSESLFVHGDIINDLIALVNGSYDFDLPLGTKGSGLYLTSQSISEDAATVEIEGTTYYTWMYGTKVYYCTASVGSTHTVTADDVLWTYTSSKMAVSPRYSRITVFETINGISCLVAYLAASDSGNDYARDANNNKIKYDGSTDPNTSAWYRAIPNNKKDDWAYQYPCEKGELTRVAGSEMLNKVLTRTLAITFSVEATTGITTIKSGILGNVCISPVGLSGGEISGSKISNANIRGCTIEGDNVDGGYSTGYYGRCFYEHYLNRDTGLLYLKRIDGHVEILDFGAMIRAAIEGSSTGDSGSISGGGSDTGGGGGSGGCDSCSSGCSGTCSGSCSGGCSTSCTNSCTGSCYSSCADSCKSGCGDSCRKTCSLTCSNNCVGGCNTTCTGGCGGGCSGGCSGGCTSCEGDCSSGCTEDCTGGCEFGCTSVCGSGCSGTCLGSCSGTCGESCLKTCSITCSNNCVTSAR